MSDIAGSISAITTSNNQLFKIEDTTKSAVSVDGQLADVNMVHISKEEYEQLVVTSSVVSSTLYVVSSEFIDAYGQQISNLAPGTGLSDAVNLEQLSNAISSIQIPTDLSAFTNSPGYLSSIETIAPTSSDSVKGKAADAKATGTALYTGFTEWEFSGGSSEYPPNPDSLSWGEVNDAWVFEDMHYESSSAGASSDDIRLIFPNIFCDDGQTYNLVATRHLITPTKTSQLTNDGDGTNAFVKTNDTRLSDARTPTAHHATHAANGSDPLAPADIGAASLSDLPYALVEPGKWEFSGLPSGVTVVDFEFDGSSWYLSLSDGDYGFASEDENILSAEILTNNDVTITATRPSLPGHLCDRAVNTVPITSVTTLTLPGMINSKSRDFYLKMTVTGSQQVSFLPISGVTYTGLGDPSKTYSSGTYLLHFRETSASEFCVTNIFTDTTLSNEGVAADAKAVGDALAEKANASEVNAALDGKRGMTDLGVHGVPEDEGSWFVVNGNRFEFYSGTPDAWAGIVDGKDVELLLTGDNSYVFRIDTFPVTGFSLDDSFRAVVEYENTTYSIVGYVGMLAKKSEIPTVPTKTSQLTNDSGFLSAIPNTYKTYDSALSSLSVDGYALSSQLTSKAETSALPYTLVNAALSSCTYNNAQCVSCQIEDRTITTISVDSNTPDVVVFLPQKQSATAARDFILRAEISAATVPGFTFVGAGNETVQYDSEDDEWYVLEPGLNLISFTETK